MPVHRQPVRAGEPGRTGADNGNPAACGRRAFERMLARLDQVVGRIALQDADLHRLALGVFAHAGLLAQRLDRADAPAHAAQDVAAEDGLGRALGIAGRDLPDEQREALLDIPFVWLSGYVIPILLFSHMACIRQLLGGGKAPE